MYADDYDEGAEDEEYDEGEDDELIYESACQELLLGDEYVSPMRKDAQPAAHSNCELAIYKSSGVYRVDFSQGGSNGQGRTLFSHYICKSSELKAPSAGGLNGTMAKQQTEYKALNLHANRAAKRVTVKFGSVKEADDFRRHFNEVGYPSQSCSSL